MTVNVFSVPVFFVVFRETLEVAVIVSVLFASLKQTLSSPDPADYRKLCKQVWCGTLLGFLLCLIIGAGMISVFYTQAKDSWANTEYYWEGAFGLLAAIIIPIMGAALLRVSKMQDKWVKKIHAVLNDEDGAQKSWKRFFAFGHLWERYFMFILPFITILREGLEAIIFIGGVSFSAPAKSIPLPIFIGILTGMFVGYLIYKGGATSKLQVFLVVSTCFLYLIAAGLFSKAVWYFQAQDWNNITGGDAAETGSGAGSYDIDQSVWHVNFGNPELNGGGGWGIFNAILGWQNSATYGSVIGYNLYWLVVMAAFVIMRYNEVKGHYPFMKAKAIKSDVSSTSGSSGVMEKGDSVQRNDAEKGVPDKSANVREVPARTVSE